MKINLTDNIFYRFDATYYYSLTYDNTFSMNFHEHTLIEIMVAEKGNFFVEILDPDNQDKKFSIEVAEKHFIVIFPNVKHKLVVPDRSRIYELEMLIVPTTSDDKFDISEMLRSVPVARSFFTKYGVYFKGTDFYDITNLVFDIQKIMYEVSQPTEKRYLLDCLVKQLILKICQIADHGNLPTVGIVHIKKAVDYISKRFTSSISLQNVAQYCGVNPLYLQRLFKAYTKTTISGYINKMRINYALHLIKANKLRLVDIAVTCGFSTRQNFHKIFSKYVGCSPSEYRKNYFSPEVKKWDID